MSESGFRPGDSFKTRLCLKLRPQQHWGISSTQYSYRVPSEQSSWDVPAVAVVERCCKSRGPSALKHERCCLFKSSPPPPPPPPLPPPTVAVPLRRRSTSNTSDSGHTSWSKSPGRLFMPQKRLGVFEFLLQRSHVRFTSKKGVFCWGYFVCSHGYA